MFIEKAELIEKKSKFISYYYEIDSKDKVKIIIDELKQNNKKARHIVYAYKIGNTAGKTDDKEPSGTAGTQIYNLIELNNLNNCLIVVVRYFGGTKLGAPLLARTYKNAALKVIKQANEKLS